MMATFDVVAAIASLHLLERKVHQVCWSQSCMAGLRTKERLFEPKSFSKPFDRKRYYHHHHWYQHFIFYLYLFLFSLFLSFASLFVFVFFSSDVLGNPTCCNMFRRRISKSFGLIVFFSLHSSNILPLRQSWVLFISPASLLSTRLVASMWCMKTINLCFLPFNIRLREINGLWCPLLFKMSILSS